MELFLLFSRNGGGGVEKGTRRGILFFSILLPRPLGILGIRRHGGEKRRKGWRWRVAAQPKDGLTLSNIQAPFPKKIFLAIDIFLPEPKRNLFLTV